MNMVERLKAYVAAVNPLQVEYVAYIKDKSIPLADRWEAFCAAPTEFQEHESWIQHFDSEELLPNGEINFYDDFYVEKYTEVYMENFIANIEEDPDYHEDWTPEIIAAFKEEILEKNMGSFTFDW